MGVDGIELDLSGAVVRVPREAVRAVAAAAAARAGVSSQHRDLSLVLGRALDRGKVSLDRRESRALRAVLEEGEDGLGPAGDELRRVLSGL